MTQITNFVGLDVHANQTHASVLERMSRLPWNLVAASGWILSGEGSAHLRGRGGVMV